MSSPPPTRWTVTASLYAHRISYDGRSPNSSAWRGGAAYVQMCMTCGLEPGRPGFVSKCMCMCGLGKPNNGGCSLALHGNGDEEGKCRNCGGGRPSCPSIVTVEVKAKRPRWTYVPHVLRGDAFNAERAAGPAVAAVAAVSAPVVVADATAVAADSVDGRQFR
jgi:hypothetical protein